MLVSSLMLLKALVKVPVMSSNKLLFTTAAVYAQLPKFTLHKNRQFQTTNLVHYTTDVQLKYKVKEVTPICELNSWYIDGYKGVN